MTRNPLILVTLALGLVLGGCSNRSIGNKIDDQFLEPNVANAISRSHPDLTGPTSHIVVTAYNGVILLAGQTPRADLKNKEKLVGKRPIFQIGPIGSRCAYFVAYITDKGLRFDAGCQRQITREVFEDRLAELHGENDHAKEYRAALALIDAHAEIWTPKEDAGEVAKVSEE